MGLFGNNEAVQRFMDLVSDLETGTVRVATRGENGEWTVHPEVKEGILEGFRIGKMENPGRPYQTNFMTAGAPDFSFVEKDTLGVRSFDVSDGVRVVPGGTMVRCGAYLAKGVIVMPPSYINIGAYVDEGTMVDSHVLVGSCAQIGKRVHLSAGTQIGGVLEPVGALPVIVEDDVFIGGNCGIYEGTVIKSGAVIGTGVIINSATIIYDSVKGEYIRPDENGCIVVPSGAVIVAGSRPLNRPKALEEGIQIYTPVLVKYRDDKTQSSINLEDTLRK